MNLTRQHGRHGVVVDADGGFFDGKPDAEPLLDDEDELGADDDQP